MSMKNQCWTVVKAGQNGFYSGTIAVGDRGPQFRTGLNSKYNKRKGGFITKEQDAGLGVEDY